MGSRIGQTMSSVIMPDDRSVKNPARGFCRNPKCREIPGENFEFPIEHAHVSCPKCGANAPPLVGVLVLTHMLIPVRGGPIRGKGGVSYALACDEKRAYLATYTNLEAASGDIEAINCPQCLENCRKLGIKRRIWEPLRS